MVSNHQSTPPIPQKIPSQENKERICLSLEACHRKPFSFFFTYLQQQQQPKKNQLGNFNKTTQLTDLQVAGLNSSKIPENTNMQIGLLSKRKFLQPYF